MTVTYHAGFSASLMYGDVAFSLNLVRAGETTATVNVASLTAVTANSNSGTMFMHDKFISTALSINDGRSLVYPYTTWAGCTFAAALQNAMTNAITGWSGSPAISVTLSSGLYTIAVDDGANFGVNWGNTGSGYCLGHTAALSGATSYAASYSPWFYTKATLTEISDTSDFYEPEGISAIALSDNGLPQDSIARTISPLHLDFTQEYEPKLNTMNAKAAPPSLFPFQRMFEHCRTVYPFLISGSHMSTATNDLDLVCILREDGCYWRPRRGHPDYDDYWHIDFGTYCIAYKLV